MFGYKHKELRNLFLRLCFLILKGLIDIKELLIHFFFVFFEVVEQNVCDIFVGFLQG